MSGGSEKWIPMGDKDHPAPTKEGCSNDKNQTPAPNSESHQPADGQRDANRPDKHTNARFKEWGRTCKKWGKLFFRIAEFLALIAAIATAWVIYGQLKEMQQDRFLDQRAWVFALDGDFQPFDDIPSSIIFKIHYRNSGRTPAMNVNTFSAVTDNSNSIPQMDSIQNAPESSGMIAPDSMVEVFHHITDNAHKLNGGHFYVFGTVWYDDIFGKHHWSQFCFLVGGDLKSFKPTEIHNGCDDN